MITATQRENRIKGIGSSDAAAILGYSPFANAADIRLIKLGLAEPEEPGELAEIGTHLEDGIASLASKRLGVKFVKPTSSYWHENGICFCHPDRQVDESRRGSDLGEMKDSGVDDGWGEEGTADIPAHVLIQCCHQMLCTDAALVHVARLGRGFRRGLFLYEVSRRSPGVPNLIEFMERALRTWWERHIVNQDPLPDTAPPASMELLKLVRREPKSTVKINSDLVRQWRDDESAAKAAAQRAEESKRRVIEALQGAEAGECEIGTLTYLEQSSSRVDTKRLRDEEPAIAARFITESTHRVARFKTAK